ncbi:MAG TPA: four helix bundle protein [Flavisolibacter sp.]|jgi:four helix bundle protein
MSSYQNFEELPIWKEARQLALEIYTLTMQYDFSKDFAIMSQIRRSAGSVMDNIAEGFERDGRLEFINFLSIAKGSAGEVRSQLYRAFDLKYIEENKLDELISSYKQLSAHIANFIKYLNKSEIKGNKFKDRV